MVDAVSTASTIQNQAQSSSARLAENFETFLTLLTAQLQNQDPLEPVDSTEFTNQLVQFSGVEQQIQTNKNIAELISITTASTAASLSGYLGQTIEVNSITGDLGEEGLNWFYEMPEGVEKVKLSIQSPDGKVVYSDDISTDKGEAAYSWSGKTNSGKELTEGRYSLVIQAEDAAGEAVNVPVKLRTQVNGIDMASGGTALTTGSGTFYFEDVLRLTAAS